MELQYSEIGSLRVLVEECFSIGSDSMCVVFALSCLLCSALTTYDRPRAKEKCQRSVGFGEGAKIGKPEVVPFCQTRHPSTQLRSPHSIPQKESAFELTMALVLHNVIPLGDTE